MEQRAIVQRKAENKQRKLHPTAYRLEREFFLAVAAQQLADYQQCGDAFACGVERWAEERC